MSDYTYKAFISYRHVPRDKKIAKKLQRMLETYKPPREFNDGNEGWKVFRDETELPTSSNLSEDIKSALRSSEYLIVICSAETSKSRWCIEEIAYFKELHGGKNENIITLLAEGEPSEVFPKELCSTMAWVLNEDGNMELREIMVEPLAANIRAQSVRLALKRLKTEFLRIAAPLLRCGYDDLYNRNQRFRIRRLVSLSAVTIVVIALFGIYSSIMFMKINDLNNQFMLKNQELQIKTRELESKTQELNETREALEKANAELSKH